MSSRGNSVGHLGNGIAGLKVAVLQTQGVQFLKTGVDLLMHGGILGGNLGEFVDQTGAALVVVALGVLETLAVLGNSLVSLVGTGLGVNRAGTLHSWGRGGARNPSSLTVGSRRILLLGWSTGRGLGRAGLGSRLGSGTVAGNVVVDALHVVVQVPSTGESKSGYGSLASLKQAQVGAFSVAVHSMGFALVAEEACVGGETQHVVHAGGMLAPVGLQVGVQVFAVESVRYWINDFTGINCP